MKKSKSPPLSSEERRQQNDRREAGRQGKYDRRRNRCGSCLHFEAPKKEGKPGFCNHHKKPFLVSDFSCVAFEPTSGSPD